MNSKVIKINTCTGHTDSIYTVEAGAVATSFFTASGDGSVVQWDFGKPEEGLLVAKAAHSVYALKYDPLYKRLLIGENNKGLHVADIALGTETKYIVFTSSFVFDVQLVENFILVAAGDGVLYVFDRKECTLLHAVRLSTASLRSIAIHPGSKFIAIAGSDFQIRFLKVGEWEVVAQITAHTNSVFTICFSTDGSLIFSGGRDAQLKVWDSLAYTQVAAVPAHLFAINDMAFSPDGRFLATASMDKTIKIWDANTFQLLKVVDKSRHGGHSTSVNTLYWSSFCDYLVSGSDDRTASIWQYTLSE